MPDELRTLDSAARAEVDTDVAAGADQPPAPERGLAARVWEELRYRDHTRGSLATSILVLSLPAILTSLAGGAIYQLVDLYFIGLLGSTATAAVGATNQVLRQFAFLITFGTAIATQMMVSQLVGAGRAAAADHVAGQSLVTAGLLSVAIACLGFFPVALLSPLTNDPEVVRVGSLYLQLTFFLMLGQVFGMIVSFILSGAGETTTPMIISLVTTPIGIVAEWALIFGHFGLPPLGIAGVAIGMAIGSAAGLALSLWVVLSGRCRVHLRARHLIPDLAMQRRILSISWQPALHMVARTMMIFFFMALSGRLGTDVQAAYTIGLRIEMVPIMIAFPIANACATLVGQNLGAGDVRRAWRSIAVAMALTTALLTVIAGAVFLWRHEVVAFFTSDPAVVAVASEYLAFSCAALVFFGVYFVAFRALQGAGDMSSPMIISIVAAALVGAPLGYYLAFETDLGPTGMWIGNLTYTVVNTVLMGAWLLTGRWTRAYS